MPYENLVSRSDTNALVPEEVLNDLLESLENESAALNMFPRVTVPTSQTRMPVLAALPVAYFVNGDTGLKQTTEIGWANKYLNVEELAAIVPIPEAVLDDTAYDIWGATTPLMRDAIARALDAAVFFGTNKPASWPTEIVTSAVSAGNVIARGVNSAAAGGLAQDISDLFGKVEDDGFDVNGVIANSNYRGRTRAIRDTQGRRMDEVTPTEWYSMGNVRYPMRGLWPSGASVAEAIAGDWSQGIVGIRRDFTYSVSTDGVITRDDGTIAFNLFQQDMVALRLVFRVAWQIKNTIRYDQPTEANRYPWAVLRSPA